MAHRLPITSFRSLLDWRALSPLIVPVQWGPVDTASTSRPCCSPGLTRLILSRKLKIDQGWVAWFVIAAVTGRNVTIYGDGKQVRDLLNVHDLLNAYDLCLDNIDQVAGQVFNVGGGVDNTISIWTEFAPILEKHLGHPLQVNRQDWRPGDQRIYVSDTTKARETLGWQPRIGVEEGIAQLFDWVRANPQLFH